MIMMAKKGLPSLIMKTTDTNVVNAMQELDQAFYLLSYNGYGFMLFDQPLIF